MTAPDWDLFVYAETLTADLEPVEQMDDDPPAWLPTKAQRAAARERDYARLDPVLIALATRVGAQGFTADDLRQAAIDAKVITGDEGVSTGQQRALSWLGPYLASRAIKRVIAPLTYPDGNKVKRASKRDRANGNAQIVYVSPEYSRVIGSPR